MESAKVKIIAYVVIVLAVVTFLGMAVMKFGGASDVDTRTQAEKLHDLENSPGVTSPQAKNFIRNERSRQEDTRTAEDAVFEGR